MPQNAEAVSQLVSNMQTLQRDMVRQTTQLSNAESRLLHCEGAITHEGALRTAPCHCLDEVQPQLAHVLAAQSELDKRLAFIQAKLSGPPTADLSSSWRNHQPAGVERVSSKEVELEWLKDRFDGIKELLLQRQKPAVS